MGWGALLTRLLITNAIGFLSFVEGGLFHYGGMASILMFDLWYLVECIIEKRNRISSGAERDEGSRAALVCLRDVSLLYPLWLSALRGAVGTATIPFVVGSALFMIGTGIRVTAMQTLGRYFTMSLTNQMEQKLLTDGIYGTMRHPGYLGLILIYSSFSLMCGMVKALLFVLPLTLLAVRYRIRLEESLLLERFGEEYRSYVARTWAILPHW